MTLRHHLPLAVALFCMPVLFGDQADDRSKLQGTWVQENGGSGGETWVIEPKGDDLHIVHSRNQEKLEDFDCNVMGRECKVKESGKEAKVTMWYNGPKLVQIDIRGNDVTKRRFGLGDGSDTLQVEIIPVGGGKTETVQFHRAQIAAAKQ